MLSYFRIAKEESFRMAGYGISARLEMPYKQAVEAAKEALKSHKYLIGFRFEDKWADDGPY